jgi:FkbM family methyltransferase
MNPVRWFKDIRFRLFYAWLTKPCAGLVTLGSKCQWTIWDSRLRSDSNVLCAGAGNDISFERALISRYGTQVRLLDPSPTGMATVAGSQAGDARLRFHALALAGQDGVLEFHLPSDPREGSFRKADGNTRGDVQFASKSLSTLMTEFSWPRIDLLKMDIEGAEFEVIDHLLAKGLEVRQICVEFHYGGHFTHSRGDMIRRILALRCAGFQLVHHIHGDHTFIHRSCLLELPGPESK